MSTTLRMMTLLIATVPECPLIVGSIGEGGVRGKVELTPSGLYDVIGEQTEGRGRAVELMCKIQSIK